MELFWHLHLVFGVSANPCSKSNGFRRESSNSIIKTNLKSCNFNYRFYNFFRYLLNFCVFYGWHFVYIFGFWKGFWCLGAEMFSLHVSQYLLIHHHSLKFEKPLEKILFDCFYCFVSRIYHLFSVSNVGKNRNQKRQYDVTLQNEKAKKKAHCSECDWKWKWFANFCCHELFWTNTQHAFTTIGHQIKVVTVRLIFLEKRWASFFLDQFQIMCFAGKIGADFSSFRSVYFFVCLLRCKSMEYCW